MLRLACVALFAAGCYDFGLLDRAADQGSVGDMLGADHDLASPADLLPPPTPTITTVLVRGSRNDPNVAGSNVYEAEGASAPPGSGVALLIKGTGFYEGTVVTSLDGRSTVDPPIYVNPAGTAIYASLRLAVDPGAGTGVVQYGLRTSNGPGRSADAVFAVNALPEMTITAGAPVQTTQMVYEYSSLKLAGALTFNGPMAPFYWVSGAVTADADLTVTNLAGGTPGCAPNSTTCANGGLGPGAPAVDNLHSGGGAGYVIMGSPGSGSGGTPPAGGVMYGDPTVVGLPSGSSGGSSLTSAGGSGGGVFRIQAGSIDFGSASVFANGGTGGTSGPGGGAGSGGTVLLQAWYSLRANANVAPGKSGGSPAGGAASPGRIRFDAGAGLTTGSFNYAGPVIDANFKTAWQGLLDHVDVQCFGGSRFDVVVDGQTPFAVTQALCNVVAGQVGKTTVVMASPASGATHTLCTMPAGPQKPTRYPDPYAESKSCRGFVIAP